MIEQLFARTVSFVLLNWQIVVGVIVLLLIGSGLFQDLRAREKVLQSKLGSMQESLEKDMTDIRTLTEEQNLRDREVFQVGLYNFNESVSRIMGEMNRTQQGQFDTFGGQLRAAARVTEEQVDRIQDAVGDQIVRFTDVLNESMSEQGQRLENVSLRLEQTISHSEERFDVIQDTLERGLQQIRAHNRQRIQQLQVQPDRGMLDVCLEVSTQLDQVAKGLGELQVMAGGASDARKPLDYLKLRGAWAEVSVEELLDGALSVTQYRAKVAVRPQSAEQADFAIILPGRGEHSERTVYLPIDTSFPAEENERLMRALEQRDMPEIQTATKALELALRVQAKRMRDAYVDPPFTTDYAILFLPTEGLYAQMVQDTEFREQLQQQYHVLLSGPTTMASLLGSLQCGLRAHTMEHRAKELRRTLGAARERMDDLKGMLGIPKAGAPAGTVEGGQPDPDPMEAEQHRLADERQRFERLYGGKEALALQTDVPSVPENEGEGAQAEGDQGEREWLGGNE